MYKKKKVTPKAGRSKASQNVTQVGVLKNFNVELEKFSKELVEKQQNMMENMFDSTQKLLDRQSERDLSIVNSTQKMQERYTLFETKLDNVAKTYVDKHDESMEAISICDEKIIDHLHTI